MEEPHDDHTHIIVTEYEPREGDTYSGQFAGGGVWNDNGRTVAESGRFSVTGVSSARDSLSATFRFHMTSVDGEPRKVIESFNCT